VFSNRARGAAGQNPCLFKWAAKQEKLQSLEERFFLTSPFIELFCMISWPISPTSNLICIHDKKKRLFYEGPHGRYRWFKSSPCNHNLFPFSDFPIACNHPNLYAAAEIRESCA
jgi:hypothetical protein